MLKGIALGLMGLCSSVVLAAEAPIVAPVNQAPAVARTNRASRPAPPAPPPIQPDEVLLRAPAQVATLEIELAAALLGKFQKITEVKREDVFEVTYKQYVVTYKAVRGAGKRHKAQSEEGRRHLHNSGAQCRRRTGAAGQVHGRE